MVSLIGSRLRTAREQRGLSLLDAAHETRIPVQRLDWLEHDNYAAFGSLTYARAFLRIYSEFLYVDASEMLHELPAARLAGSHNYRYLTDNFGPWVIADRRLERQLRDAARQKKATRSPVPAGIAMFAAVLIGLGLWGHHMADVQAQSQAQQGQVSPASAHAAPAPVTAPAPGSVFHRAEAEIIREAIPVRREIIAAQAGEESALVKKAIPIPGPFQPRPVLQRLAPAFDTGIADRVQ